MICLDSHLGSVSLRPFEHLVVRTESAYNYSTASINLLNKLPFTDKAIVLRDKTSVALIKHVFYPAGLFPAKKRGVSTHEAEKQSIHLPFAP